MDLTKYIITFMALCALNIYAIEPPAPQGIRPSNLLGGAGQHASFSFVRPGLTQTSYAFNGPSSHQAFSSSIGNPHLAQKVLPNVAHALAYRNPGLGYFPTGPVTTGYASANQQYHQPAANSAPAPAPAGQIVYQGTPLRVSQGQVDQASALAYLQQQFQQQYQQQYLQAQAQQYQDQNYQAQAQAQPQQDTAASYHAQLAQLQSLRQAQVQSSEQAQQQVPEQLQLQQQEQHQQQQQQQQTQNLLGVAYSSAPSVAHVKANGNGYNFDF